MHEDIASDDEKPNAATTTGSKKDSKEQKPAMFTQIKKGISNLLGDDEDDFGDIADLTDEEDYDMMIEKDMDNWI